MQACYSGDGKTVILEMTHVRPTLVRAWVGGGGGGQHLCKHLVGQRAFGVAMTRILS
jgi:hypothetical protein